jgi:hypothetical protein
MILPAPLLLQCQLFSLGMLKSWLGWDWAASEAALRKAIALDAVNALADRALAVVLSRNGTKTPGRRRAGRAPLLRPQTNNDKNPVRSSIRSGARLASAACK